jgi:hypothetical protein
MNGMEKIQDTFSRLDQYLKDEIILIEMLSSIARLKITLKDGTVLYIQFNDFDEYGYQIIFSEQDLDRVRFDNFDEKWNISTKPHHFHPRFQEDALKSPFVGIPIQDIPLLCELINSKCLLDSNFKFD